MRVIAFSDLHGSIEMVEQILAAMQKESKGKCLWLASDVLP